MPTKSTGFVPSIHGLPFPNSYPVGTPVVKIPTPFGELTIGDASHGLCGGMIFAALDCFLWQLPHPTEPTQTAVRYFAKRLIDSWNLPFGVMKYYDGQRRPTATRFFAGVPVIDGLTKVTVLTEWPRIRQCLDTGMPAALGLVNVESYDFRKLALNHQVLAYGYDLAEDESQVTLQIYDPNYPNDDTATLTLTLNHPDGDCPIHHSCEGPHVRGVFLTEYTRPSEPPLW
jgi:hypothetical protein